MTEGNRWRRRPEGSTWGDFGPDDQAGRLNLLTPDKVRQGLAEAREGLTFCLSLPLDLPGGNTVNPSRHPPVLRPTLKNGRPLFLYRADADHPDHADVLNDDAVILHLQYSTQWDSLSHVGRRFDADADGVPELVFYNGYRGGEDVVGPTDAADAGLAGRIEARSTSAARALGVERMAERCMQGRAAMIDLHAHLGEARTLVGYDLLMRIMDADGVAIEKGDMACLHTGFAQLVLEMGGKPDAARLRASCAVLDGADERLLRWVSDSGVVALIADNYAVEHLPGRDSHATCSYAPLHQHCLFKLGVYLGELWHLTPLARWLRAHGRNRFLLTAPPLRLPGAVGSPATPVATV